MTRKPIIKVLSIITAMFFISACGGDDEGVMTSPTPTPTANIVPAANAGVDQSVNSLTTITLSGSGTDSDGNITTYAWTQIAGVAVTLANAQSASTSFDAPTTTTGLGLTFQLMVTDNDDASATDTVDIIVNAAPNEVPTADAGMDQSVDEQTAVTLSGSGTHIDGNVVSYSWSQTRGESVALFSADSPSTSFDTPTTATELILTFQLTVTDNLGAAAVDDVDIIVVPVNILPTADAGDNQSIASPRTLSLVGAGSDPDGFISAYDWSQIAGQAVSINDVSSSTATFDSPVTAANDTLVFNLMVTDNEGATAEDTVSINIAGSDPDGMEQRNQARVIFSGHSLTSAAVPTVRAIASEKGNDLIDIYQDIPGSPIRMRTRGSNPTNDNVWDGYRNGTPNGLNLVSEFRSPTQLPSGERYDTLVITERHDILGTVQWESTTSLLRHFHDRLLESSAGGRTYFYNSWLSIDKSNPAPWIAYELDSLMTWECVSSKVNDTLEVDGLSPNVRTLGVGWALARMVQSALNMEIPGLTGNSQQDILNQIFSDNVHLAAIGQLYVGAFSYSEIFGQPPSGFAIPGDVSQETGEALLAMAWSLTQEYRARGNSHSHDMAACRDHISNNICEPFWTYFFGRDDQVSSCRSFFGNEGADNPFTNDMSNWKTWPTPP
jgi:hypothetical protein